MSSLDHRLLEDLRKKEWKRWRIDILKFVLQKKVQCHGCSLYERLTFFHYSHGKAFRLGITLMCSLR